LSACREWLKEGRAARSASDQPAMNNERKGNSGLNNELGGTVTFRFRLTQS